MRLTPAFAARRACRQSEYEPSFERPAGKSGRTARRPELLVAAAAPSRDAGGVARETRLDAGAELASRVGGAAHRRLWSKIRRLGRRRWVGCEHEGQLAASGDPELGEHAVEMCRDRAVREIEPLSDLAVRESLGGKLCDL